MITKSKKFKKRSSIFFSLLFGILTLLIVGFFVVTNLKINRKRADLISQINRLEEEIQALEKKNEELKMGISEISSEEYLEKEAREKLGLKKPGEEVVAIKKVETEEGVKETQKGKNLWQKILEFFR